MPIYTQRILGLLFLSYVFLLSHVYAYRYFNTQYYYHPRAKVLIPQKKIQQPKEKEPQNTSWHGYFSAQRFESTFEDKQKLLQVRSNIQKSLESLSYNHTKNLKHLEVKNVSHTSRGLANDKKIILNIGTIDTNDEMIAVFTHEMGHVVDLGLLKGKHGHETNFVDRKKKVLSDDPSIEFYSISWISSKQKKAGTKRYDFVSGYAMSNPFEDFAESYLFYRYHGEKFRTLMTTSDQLAKKYQFMKENVFDGKEYQLSTITETSHIKRIWDATLLTLPKDNRLVVQR